ncbi:GNAT family N-acetyltransferase [Roseibium algae]|uniref:GNAT family N-acetyltransferase n=1 Tax=Roseibium algae TaxID=3123038 RepID=A0ABU8THJ3_9HYPH
MSARLENWRELGTSSDFGYVCLRHDAPGGDEVRELFRRLPGGAVSTPFQTPDFLRAFQANMLEGVGGSFSLYEFRRAGTSTPLMLLPILTRKRGPIRIASMPDLTLADQNAPVLAKAYDVPPSHMPTLWATFLQNLTGADVLDFHNMTPMVEQQINPLYGLGDAAATEHLLMLDLQNDAAVAEWRRKSVFKELRSKFRKLEAEGVRFFMAETPDERLAVCKTILRQKQTRFETLGRDNLLSSKSIANLYLDLAKVPHVYSPARLFGLRTDNEVVAGLMSLSSEDMINAVLLSIGDERWHRMSPGIVLMSKVVDWAQSAGVKNFSFGTGYQRYKQRFGAEPKALKKISRSLTRAGEAYTMMRFMKDAAEQRLRRA